RVRRAELHLHEARNEAPVRARRAESRPGVRARAQSLDNRRRYAGVEVGIDERLHRRRLRSSRVRMEDSRSHLRHIYPAKDETARRDWIHAGSAVDESTALPAPVRA